MGLPAGQGVVISDVTRATAMESRLQPGLVILQVGRSPVGSVSDFNKATAGLKKGDVLMLLIQTQQGIKQFVAVTIGGAR